jgi:hypothetical protein
MWIYKFREKYEKCQTIAGIQTFNDEFLEYARSIERSLTKSMDKVSNLAFLLYNESTNVAVKQAAVKLLTGDLTVKEIKNNNETKAPFNNASKKLRKGYIKKEELNQFIEQHMYSSNEILS